MIKKGTGSQMISDFIEFTRQEKELTELINKKLYEYSLVIKQPLLKDSMAYSLFAGGKRIRPLLMIFTAIAENVVIDNVMPFACALECIHTYSLIHDDLPAIDNDDLRRGKPSNHKYFDEAVAILAGDGLLNIAFEIMSEYCLNNLSKENVSVMNEIAVASGVNGMISGQMDDIKNEYNKRDEGKLICMYQRKTGRLFKAAITCGAVLGGMSQKSKDFSDLSEAAANLGEAFQIRDDILDVISNQEKIGKPTKSDERNEKNTYLSIFGIEDAEKRFQCLSESAIITLSELYGEMAAITHFAKKLTSRAF